MGGVWRVNDWLVEKWTARLDNKGGRNMATEQDTAKAFVAAWGRKNGSDADGKKWKDIEEWTRHPRLGLISPWTTQTLGIVRRLHKKTPFELVSVIVQKQRQC